MGLFNRKNLEGRTAEKEDSRDPQGTEVEAEVVTSSGETRAAEPAPAESVRQAADPYGEELLELETKAAAEPAPEPAGSVDPAPEPVDPPAEAADVAGDAGKSATGKLDKDELRRAVKGGGDGESEDDGRVSADELIAPTLKRRHPYSPESEEPAAERTMQVFAFANQKGGVAKTTTTLNLAVALSESGHRVLCVDLDPQGNLTMSQGVDPDTVEKSLYHVLVDRMPIKEIIQHREVDIAVASIDLAGAEIAMSTQIGRERSLQKALAQVADEYDYVCIDTPPSLGLLTINALTAADKVIVPVQCEYLSMRGLVQLQNTLEMIRENLNPDVQIEGILPTMLDTRTIHAKEAVEILEENFGDLVFKSRIKKAIKFAEAPVKGSSVLKYDPQSNAAQCYRDLAEEVLEHGSKE
ncbi:MAG: AAA family ATPase [Solirubrobacterales bacterium]